MSTSTTCQECGRVYTKPINFCLSCGTKMRKGSASVQKQKQSTGTSPIQASPAVVTTQTTTCQQCGREYTDPVKFCLTCGHKIDRSNATYHEQVGQQVPELSLSILTQNVEALDHEVTEQIRSLHAVVDSYQNINAEYEEVIPKIQEELDEILKEGDEKANNPEYLDGLNNSITRLIQNHETWIKDSMKCSKPPLLKLRKFK